MLRMKLAAGIAATALIAGAAFAQTTVPPASGTTTAPATSTTAPAAQPAPPASPSTTTSSASGATQPAGSGQVMTQMPADQFRASKLMGVDVYGTDNAKIGDIDEILIDKQGKIHGVVVGVGGFLGIGQKDVAIPFDEVQWMTSQQVQAQNSANAPATNTAGGVTSPNAPASGTNPPATTGSTGGAAGSGSASNNADANTPARAMVKMTKADLQNAPEFRYSGAANR